MTVGRSLAGRFTWCFNIEFCTIYYCSQIFKTILFEAIGSDISRNSSFVEKGKRNTNSFSRNKIQVIFILLPVPVVIPKISHSISRLGFLLSLTRVNTNCSLVVSLASSFLLLEKSVITDCMSITLCCHAHACLHVGLTEL